MSLCFLLQRKNEIYMAGDSRVSVQMGGKKYRWHDNYSKIEKIGNYVVFKGGSAGVMNNIINKFKESNNKDLTTLQKISIDEFNNHVIREGNNFKPYTQTNTMTVSIIVSTIENDIPVVYFISDATNLNIIKIELPEEKDIQDISLGVNSDEAGEVYKSCIFDFNDFDNVFDNYRKIYEGATGTEIGGTLTVFRISNDEIKSKQCGLMNPEYVDELSDHLLDTYFNKLGDMRYKGFANCLALKIQGTNILDELNQKINGQYLANNSVGAAQIKTNELVVGDNISMGPNAYISWNQVTSQPFIPQDASDIGAISSTYIDANSVYTGKIYANKIVGGELTATNYIQIGNRDNADKNLYMYTSSGFNVNFSAFGGESPELQISANKIYLGDSVYIGTPSNAKQIATTDNLVAKFG